MRILRALICGDGRAARNWRRSGGTRGLISTQHLVSGEKVNASATRVGKLYTENIVRKAASRTVTAQSLGKFTVVSVVV